VLTMARGDLFEVDLPAPSGRAGREQVGPRPCIIVQTGTADAVLPTTMIVPLTSKLSALSFPHTFRVDPSPENGLSTPSVPLVFQLRAIDKRRLGNRIGHIEKCHLLQLENEMRLLLGL